ncbi:MAG: galactokinase, partial [Chloroflexota bacterium]|nr:galactokinase [Chloroflexota bacterium]
EPFATLYAAQRDEMARVALAGDDGDAPTWARYPLAVWRRLVEAGAAPATPGFRAVIHGDVPLGAGLSSSAALEVATAMFARALGGAPLAPLALARLCQRAEQEGAGAQVGIMDQATACLGRPGRAILLDCRSLTYEYLPARPPGAVWVVFDTGAPHSVAASEYNARRAQCEAAVARLAPALERESPGRRVTALRDVEAGDLERHAALLDATILRRARHVVSEIGRTLLAAAALRVGDVEALGVLLNASHASLRDDYAVSGPQLDAAVEIAQAAPGVLGARMMGAGFGGSIIALVRRESAADLRARLTTEYPRRTGLRGAVIACAITGQMGFSAMENGA